MDNFLNRLAPRPSDYGGLPGKITREDDAGNVYDETGRRIFNKFDPVDQPDSWLDTAISTATAPAKLATGLVGSLNPHGQDGWQVPPIISEPAAAFARSGELTGFGDDGQFYLPNVQNPQVAQDTLTQLMTVYGGNALNPLARVPKGAIASGAVKQAADALPMDQASRLQRARDMGFDTETPLYHGTRRDFDAFMQPQKHSQYGPGVYTARNPDEASRYAMIGDNVEGSRVLPLYAKQGQYATGDQIDKLAGEIARSGKASRRSEAYELAVKQLMDEGYLGVDTAGGYRSVFDPRNIRSVNAAFDPSRAGENGLLLSDNRPSLMGSALASMQDNPFRMSQAQIQAELGARPGDLLVPSASSPDGFALRDYPVPERNDLGTEPLSGYDRALLEREWRNKIRQTGELYSDNKPSLLGSALASGQGEEDILALLGYR